MKKGLAFLLCLVMLLTLVPAAIAEQSGPAEEPTAEEALPKGDIKVNATNFPDANFRAWIKANITGGSDTLTQAQMDGVTTIFCDHEEIASLKGISRFKNLEYLYCQYNKIEELDLDNNRKLLVVDCDHNYLTKLSVSACVDLWHLNCSNNRFTSQNISYNKKLRELDISNNQLAKLNVESNTALEELDCSGNKLTSLNVSKNTGLYTLRVDVNQLTKLDVSKNTELQYLRASKNNLSALDVTKNTKLVELIVSFNNLTALDVTKNTKLQTLEAVFNSLKSINVTKCTALKVLNIEENNLSALNVSKNNKLQSLFCSGNSIKELDVSACPVLYILGASDNALKKIDLKKNTNLGYLYLYSNSLTELDLSNNPKLIALTCDSNYIAALDVSGCKNLESLDCGNNQIVYLNLSNNTKLKELYCQGNRLEFLNVGGCTQLETLECQGNRLRSLHLNNNTKLKQLSMSPQNSVDALKYTQSGGKYTYNMRNLFETGSEASYVKAYSSSYSYNASTGVMTLPGNNDTLPYLFDTGRGDMGVFIRRYYTGSFTVEFDEYAVEYKGTTPYVIYNGAEQRPAFTVRDSNGKWIDPEDNYFDFWYTNNTKPGTGMLHVRMYGSNEEKTIWFKIYMPASTKLTVENVSAGIWLTWAAVPDAKGYVIYRRAWNLQSAGWTTFERWNNTTDTEWLDSKVYAGTRYQYGVKAYYTDPMDNYNLGIVSPLKTTVRITTRTLTSVTPGTKQLTAKWGASKVFTGYEVQVATNAEFTKNVKTVRIEKATTTQTTVKDLQANTTYYVRVRSYHIFEGMTYYGGWSSYKSCKTN